MSLLGGGKKWRDVGGKEEENSGPAHKWKPRNGGQREGNIQVSPEVRGWKKAEILLEDPPSVGGIEERGRKFERVDLELSSPLFVGKAAKGKGTWATATIESTAHQVIEKG